MRLSLLAPVGALLLALTAASPAAAQRIATAGDSGKTFVLAQGEELRLDLAENPSTGERWRTTRRPARRVLRFLRSGAVSPPGGAAPVAGAPQRRVYVFRAGRPGRGTLRLSLVGPGRNPEVRRRFTLRVVVVALVRPRGDRPVSTLRRGQHFRITVSEGAGPAGRWRLTAPPRSSVLRLVSEERDPPPPDGGQATRTFLFRAVGRGTTQIEIGSAAAGISRYQVRVR